MPLDETIISRSDEQVDDAQRDAVRMMILPVEEVGTGADANKVRVRIPGEDAVTADLALAEVFGAMPVVGDNVLTLIDSGVRRVVTGAPGGSSGAITGEIKMWSGSTAPAGYLLCDGTTYTGATYPDLFALIGTTYGAGAAGTFKVPDMRGRVPMGVGTSDAADGTLNSLGQKRGAETHTLSQTQMPAHTHTTGFDLPVTDNTATTGTAGRLVGAGVDLNITSSSTGGGAAHNNLQPSTGVNFIIKT